MSPASFIIYKARKCVFYIAKRARLLEEGGEHEEEVFAERFFSKDSREPDIYEYPSMVAYGSKVGFGVV